MIKDTLSHLPSGTVTFLFMLGATLLTMDANLSEPIPLNEHLFLVTLFSFLAYTVYSIVALLRAFRIPW